MKKIRCLIGIHMWEHPNHPFNQDQPDATRRECLGCNKEQHWDYDYAREKGIIVWRDIKG